MKKFLGKLLAVVMTMVMTGIAMLLWFFQPEIIEHYHCPEWVPLILSILCGCIGLVCSCFVYEQKDDRV